MFSKKQKKLLTIHYQLSTSSGFTLIEILLVTFITGMVFISVYLLFASTIKHDAESRHEIIASNLAQEGIEIIRNKRDEEILKGNPIDSWISATCFPYLLNAPHFGCGTGTKKEVGFFALEGIGRYRNCQGACGSDQETSFERTCTIAASDSDGDTIDDTLAVSCTVSWKSFVNPNIVRDVEAVSVMTDWGKD